MWLGNEPLIKYLKGLRLNLEGSKLQVLREAVPVHCTLGIRLAHGWKAHAGTHTADYCHDSDCSSAAPEQTGFISIVKNVTVDGSCCSASFGNKYWKLVELQIPFDLV